MQELENAVFISYTHLDNEVFGPEQLRWVSHLHEQLKHRVQQYLGDAVKIWRDDKLAGNDTLDDALHTQLGSVAVMVTVCSPRYVKSDWCRWELEEFVRAVGPELRMGARSRLFKVLKTPVAPENLPDPLAPLLGYEFFEELPQEGRVREYLLNPNPAERWKFYARVDDLAQDIAQLLSETRASDETATGQTAYLAQVTSDLAAHRDDLRRELSRRGWRILPQRSVPLLAKDLYDTIDSALAESTVSVHLLGTRYGTRPEGEEHSIPHIELELAGQAASESRLTQLIWLPEDVTPDDETQASLVQTLRSQEVGYDVELLQGPFDALKAHLLDLTRPPEPGQRAVPAGPARLVYLVCDREDFDAIAPVKRALEESGHTVLLPLREGTDVEAREVHETSLVLCDAALVFYGAGSEHWLRMKLFDFLKAAGWGRERPFVAKGVYVAQPASPHKESYATSEALVLRANGAGGPALEPFLAALGASTGA